MFSSLLYLLDYSTENKIFATVDTFISADYTISSLFSSFMEVVSLIEAEVLPVAVFSANSDDPPDSVKYFNSWKCGV